MYKVNKCYSVYRLMIDCLLIFFIINNLGIEDVI